MWVKTVEVQVLSPACLLCRIPQKSTKTQCLCGYFAFRLASMTHATLIAEVVEPLEDGSMPLPIDATTYEQRRATIAQQRNLVARLRKFTAWQREQHQEPQ